MKIARLPDGVDIMKVDTPEDKVVTFEDLRAPSVTRIRSVYLAGAVFGLDDRGQRWRQQAIEWMPDCWVAVNPMLVELAATDPEALVRADYVSIMSCDAVLAHVEQPSWGTAMELAFARQWNIPVIGWKLVQGEISPWLKVHLTCLRHSLREAIGELKNVGSDNPKSAHNNRRRSRPRGFA